MPQLAAPPGFGTRLLLVITLLNPGQLGIYPGFVAQGFTEYFREKLTNLKLTGLVFAFIAIVLLSYEE